MYEKRRTKVGYLRFKDELSGNASLNYDPSQIYAILQMDNKRVVSDALYEINGRTQTITISEIFKTDLDIDHFKCSLITDAYTVDCKVRDGLLFHLSKYCFLYDKFKQPSLKDSSYLYCCALV